MEFGDVGVQSADGFRNHLVDRCRAVDFVLASVDIYRRIGIHFGVVGFLENYFETENDFQRFPSFAVFVDRLGHRLARFGDEFCRLRRIVRLEYNLVRLVST